MELTGAAVVYGATTDAGRASDEASVMAADFWPWT